MFVWNDDDTDFLGTDDDELCPPVPQAGRATAAESDDMASLTGVRRAGLWIDWATTAARETAASDWACSAWTCW